MSTVTLDNVKTWILPNERLINLSLFLFYIREFPTTSYNLIGGEVMENYKLLFYDFEVFCEDWLVVVVDYTTKKECVIINDIDKLTSLYNKSKDCVFVGYNSRHYDQFIFKGLLDGQNPYRITKDLIENGKKGYQCVKNHYKYSLNNFDITTGFHSLKQLEAFMGIDIKESSVPFDIQRKLTQEEIYETVKYCRHDVLSTIEVFNNRKEEFESQVGLIEMYDLSLSDISKTKAQLSAHILGAKKVDRDDEWDITLPDNLILDKYSYVRDWFLTDEIQKPKAKLETEVYGVPHVFALGGIHGATKKRVYDGIIGCWDVASLYPSTIIEYGLMSRNVNDPSKYKEIRDLRIEYKHKKDPRQAPLKIVLNSTYGILNDKYSQMYDPRQAHLVCIYNQLFLLDLIEKIEIVCGENAELIQSNTDGVYFQFKDLETLELANIEVAKWEKRTRYVMELDMAKKIIQRDVNNYILVTENGKVKSKGAVVKKLNPLDYDLPIVNKAVKAYLTEGVRIEDYINKCDDLIEFQKVCKLGSNYKYMLNGDEILPTKVNRVFASKLESDGGIFKWKKDKDKADKVANTPEKAFIDNDDIKNKKVPEKLDKDWYVKKAIDEVQRFLGIKYEVMK